MFATLGGTPNLPVDKVTPTVNRLRKRARWGSTFDLRREGELRALGDLIVKAARTLKSPMGFVSYEEFQEQLESVSHRVLGCTS